MGKYKGQAVYGQMEDAPLAITVAISDKFIYELLREENSLAWGEWKSSLKEWSSELRPAPGAEVPVVRALSWQQQTWGLGPVLSPV